MPDETIQADADALVAMSVADLAAHLDGVDLPTLEAALATETAKGDQARKGALAALEAAIEGHPENAAAAANAAEQPAPSEQLEDIPADPDALSAAPPRPHDGIVGQFEVRWGEFKNFIADLEGDLDGELGEVLAFIRSKL